jgi:hypothetical protein
VLPLCGAAPTFFACRKESRQRKRLHPASLEAGPPAWRGQWYIWNLCPRTFAARDKAVILPATLRAPSRSFANYDTFAISQRYSRLPFLLLFVHLIRQCSLYSRANKDLEVLFIYTFECAIAGRPFPVSTKCEAGSMTALSRVGNV